MPARATYRYNQTNCNQPRKANFDDPSKTFQKTFYRVAETDIITNDLLVNETLTPKIQDVRRSS